MGGAGYCKWLDQWIYPRPTDLTRRILPQHSCADAGDKDGNPRSYFVGPASSLLLEHFCAAWRHKKSLSGVTSLDRAVACGYQIWRYGQTCGGLRKSPKLCDLSLLKDSNNSRCFLHHQGYSPLQRRVQIRARSRLGWRAGESYAFDCTATSQERICSSE